MKFSLGISNFLERSLIFPIPLLSSISLHLAWSSKDRKKQYMNYDKLSHFYPGDPLAPSSGRSWPRLSLSLSHVLYLQECICSGNTPLLYPPFYLLLCQNAQDYWQGLKWNQWSVDMSLITANTHVYIKSRDTQYHCQNFRNYILQY